MAWKTSRKRFAAALVLGAIMLASAGAAFAQSADAALRLYRLGSAWFAHDDDISGSLVPGKLADLAVLTQDYLTVPVEHVGEIESLLTMVGGRVVYEAGPFANVK